MKKNILFVFLASIILFGSDACTKKVKLTPGEATTIAREAYIYGFPMVMGYKAMNSYTLDKNNPEYKGPFNKLACNARVYTPDDKAVVTPNSDTPYCMMWGDISQEPVVITVPDMEPDRFYHFQLVDLYTHNFAYIGTLATGNGPGKYMVSGAGWSGETPKGIDKVIPCETPYFLIIVRTQLFGPGDLDNVKTIQEAYDVQPLSEFMGGEPVPFKETIAIPEWHEGDQFNANIFPYIDALLDLIKPVSAEKDLMKRFARLDLGKHKTFDMGKFTPEIQAAIEKGAKEGLGDIENFLGQVTKDPLSSTKIFGTREFLEKSARENYSMDNLFLLRATAAQLGLYGNSGEEAIYPLYFTDQDGNPLNAAANNYTMTFQEGQLPPVKDFWSLTMYDGKTQLLIRNPLNRYLLNSTMKDNYFYGEDGSLTFYIQRESPGKELENNWLPSPDGPFYCVLRLYGPEKAALNGEWVNPPLVISK